MSDHTRHERLIETAQLSEQLSRDDLRLVDLSAAKIHHQYHIPGAVFLDYGSITAMKRPVLGLLPEISQLEQLLGNAGISPDHFVVAYDEEGGGKAARLLWTLKTLGHKSFALLNGGLHAWANEERPLQSGSNNPNESCTYQAQINLEPIVERNWIQSHLNDETVIMLDARSHKEYLGQKAYSAKAGRIPGAVHFDWLNAIDQKNSMRLMPEADMRQILQSCGITPQKTVVNYCQTHHRSSLTWFLLEWLGYPHNKGYPGSWSDWGNRNDTPIESGN